MNGTAYHRWVFGLSLAGVLFSGYLSLHKLFSGTCAFNETCSYFLGYPACWYGFAMFLCMFLVSGFSLRKKMADTRASRWLFSVSALGILFAGYFVFLDVGILASGMPSVTSGLGLPICVYGLILYLAIFILSIVSGRRRP